MTAKEKRAELITEAEELGLTFAKNISTIALEDMVREENDKRLMDESSEEDTELDPDLDVEDETDVEEVGGVVESAEEIRAQIEKEYEIKLEEKAKEIEAMYALNHKADTRSDNLGLLKLKAQKRATRLIRCIVTNRNPLKQSWDGEIFTVSNDLIGQQRKFVPFSLDEGYHLPQIIIDTLKDKECTVFVNSKTKNGEKVKVGKLIKEYAIEILPPLTQKELGALASQQAARGSIDNDDS